jgi:hypothetical protein
VTIVAGFKCADGAVLCADTQETVGNAKTKVPKLQMCSTSQTDHAEDLLLAIAGAGNGPFIDKLITCAWNKAQTATSFDDACLLVEESIEETHKKFGEIFQVGYLPDAELAYAVKMDGQTKLFSAIGPIVNEQKHFVIHGCGYDLGAYICNQMCPGWTAPSLSQLAILAEYIVYEAKIHVDGVGGDTHLATLRNTGDSSADLGSGSNWIDQHFQYLDGFIGPAFLASADVETPDFLAHAHLDELVGMLKLGRQEMQAWREKVVEFTKNLQDKMEERNRINYPWRYRTPESETQATTPSTSQKSEPER